MYSLHRQAVTDSYWHVDEALALEKSYDLLLWLCYVGAFENL